MIISPRRCIILGSAPSPSTRKIRKELRLYCHMENVMLDFYRNDGTGFSCIISREDLLNDIDAIKKQIEGAVIPVDG